jgi:hypothetical protein
MFCNSLTFSAEVTSYIMKLLEDELLYIGCLLLSFSCIIMSFSLRGCYALQ